MPSPEPGGFFRPQVLLDAHVHLLRVRRWLRRAQSAIRPEAGNEWRTFPTCFNSRLPAHGGRDDVDDEGNGTSGAAPQTGSQGEIAALRAEVAALRIGRAGPQVFTGTGAAA
ncbi:hypothetical protein [Micromonospora globbae]|uniref:hypothetical protein n=1 Tax=Micromonospora globbae TaxID=1894969 RepID=UPI00342AB5EF